MKEVVKNEVLKLLNAGEIYAIFDSIWVSPVKVVPKKGGITVVKNENDELICYNQIAISPENHEKTTFTCPYDLMEEIMEVFMDDFSIKKALVTAPIMIVPDWKEPFKLMCDASDYAVGAVLGQRREKMYRVIYYASRTMDSAQQNYTTTEKEMLAVVFAFDKFRPYLVGTKVKDKKGSENQVADHLSRLELEEKKEEESILEIFPDEQLFEVNSVLPWFADIANFLSCGTLLPDLSHHQKNKFFLDIKFLLWDDPFVYKRCADQVTRRCVDDVEAHQILEQCHSSPYDGHFGASRTATKKWVEAIATNTNDARVVAKFVHKHIFTRVKHKVALAYHPQSNGQAEISNRNKYWRRLSKQIGRIGPLSWMIHCGLIGLHSRRLLGCLRTGWFLVKRVTCRWN
ncbi:uncharacterized protein LOC142544236 [Primulina tabacum]|uniref:uncharacterized protein LOC142544236 n=1 Tax=Primulina tabacum TaxID=48773 RepID=UPI003F5A0809